MTPREAQERERAMAEGWNEAIASAVEKLEEWKATVKRKQRGELIPDPALEVELKAAGTAIKQVWGLRKP
jgi:hypothetical protein